MKHNNDQFIPSPPDPQKNAVNHIASHDYMDDKLNHASHHGESGDQNRPQPCPLFPGCGKGEK